MKFNTKTIKPEEQFYVSGVRVVVHPIVIDGPKIALRDSVTCSDGVRGMLNAYLLDMFGTKPTYLQVNHNGVPTLYVSPAGAANLRRAYTRG